MKKSIVLFAILFTSLLVFAGAEDAVKGKLDWNKLQSIIGVTIDAYKAAPNAKYTVSICDNHECRYATATSCDEAKLYAKNALEFGAKKVTIVSDQITIHKSCRNKTYYPGQL